MSPDSLVAHHGEFAEDHSHEPNNVFGFWLYLMTDCILFATLFAGFAVARHQYAGDVSGRDIFNLPYVGVETALLLISSSTYGFAMIGAYKRDLRQVVGWLCVTFLLGLGFVGMEINEFHHLVAEGHGPDRSAFLSAFFTLVATHGLHVTCGLIWMVTLVCQMTLLKKGLTTVYVNRLMCLSLFWHFLDIVWICVFTLVYLLGVQ
jgi:cytochrome o ubiquinol oxidase subunit 3